MKFLSFSERNSLVRSASCSSSLEDINDWLGSLGHPIAAHISAK